MKKTKILLNVLLGFYAVLTLIAVVSDLQANGFHVAHGLFMVGSILLVMVIFRNTRYSLALLITGLVVMHLAAIFAGQLTGFHLSHHIVRAVVSLLLILLFVKTHP